jgi:hypothetical protein
MTDTSTIECFDVALGRPVHYWDIPSAPFFDVDGRLIAMDDPRRDYTCRRCGARRPAEHKLAKPVYQNVWRSNKSAKTQPNDTSK